MEKFDSQKLLTNNTEIKYLQKGSDFNAFYFFREMYSGRKFHAYGNVLSLFASPDSSPNIWFQSGKNLSLFLSECSPIEVKVIIFLSSLSLSILYIDMMGNLVSREKDWRKQNGGWRNFFCQNLLMC